MKTMTKAVDALFQILKVFKDCVSGFIWGMTSYFCNIKQDTVDVARAHKVIRRLPKNSFVRPAMKEAKAERPIAIAN